MTFREFVQKYKKKRKRIGNVSESNTEFFYCLARFAEKHLKKAYNAGYWEGFEKGVDKGWDECESVKCGNNILNGARIEK